MHDERDYYAMRAATEWIRADNATDPAAARIHAELAQRYEMMAVGEVVRPLRWGSAG